MRLVEVVLAAGWIAHLASWSLALWRARGAAAAPGEWMRESAIRAGLIALVAASLIAPSRPVGWGAPLLVVLFLVGQAVAIVARLQLGPSWGLGIQPRTRGPATRTGLYAVMSHPIYAGTGLAIVAQAAILRNAPALILTLAGIVVIALKASRERRWLGARTPRG